MTVEVSIEKILKEALSKVTQLGFEVTKQGSIVLNESLVYHTLSKALMEYGVIYTSIRDAIKNYPDLIEKYGFKKIKIDPKNIDDGVFLYVPKNTRLVDPIYTCFVLGRRGVRQRVYNLTVIDDGGEAVAATGCLSLVEEGYHTSFTEVYVGRNAKLYKIMIHNWTPSVAVSTVKKITLMDNAVYYDYYVNYTQLKKISFITEIYHEGSGSTSRSDTIVVGKGESNLGYTTTAYLLATDASAEIISRLLGMDKSSIESRATIVAEVPGTRGHVECHGLLLSDNATITTIPVLKSSTSNTNLTHEASIGRISQDELEYLMARGFTEDEAVSIIIRGFLELGIEKIPPKLRPMITSVLDRLSAKSM